LGVLAAALPMASAGDIVLNEIMADNQAAVANTGQYPDWIELYNKSTQYIDLGGLGLTDDLLLPGKFVFPPSTLIPPRGFYVVWCDDADNLPGLHTHFGLNNKGQTVALFDLFAPGGPTALDSVSFGPQLPDLSIGRVPDGTGGWALTAPRAMGANVAQALGSAAKLKINEWMAKPAAGDDWFELYNPELLPVALGGLFLTDTTANPTLSPIPDLSFVAAEGFLEFIADRNPQNGPNHANFKLAASGSTIALYDNRRALIDSVVFGAQSQDVSQGRLPDGAANIVSFLVSASPGDSNYLPLYNVVINEVLSHTDPPFEDAVEFYNPSTADVDISGWYLTNDKRVPKKCRLPEGTTVPAGGYCVIYQSLFCPDPLLPTSFTFNSAHGDAAYLFATANGLLTGHRAGVKFGATENGVSWGRYYTRAVNDFVPLSRPTFGVDNPTSVGDFERGKGASNAPPKIGPVVINEIMYHPPDLITPTSTNDNVLEEYVELHNLTTSAVPLCDPFYPTHTWRLANAVSYSFPPRLFLPPRGYVLVVGFDPATNDMALLAFRMTYSLADTVPIYGPWQGKLGNGGDTVELLKPDTPQLPPHPDAGYVPYLQVDRVKYTDGFPWPSAADGSGASLQKRAPTAYGNDALNWFAGAPSPARSNGALQFELARLAGGSVALEFIGEAGQSYTVQYRDSLSAGAWLKLKDIPLVLATQSYTVTDALPVGGGARFYRLISPAQP
jgi:hypothetical protein